MTETDAIGQFNAVAEVRALSFDLFSGLFDNVRAIIGNFHVGIFSLKKPLVANVDFRYRFNYQVFNKRSYN